MKTLTIYEHQPLRLADNPKQGLTKPQLRALQAFHGDGKDFPYYHLIHEGVKFRSYVGVIRVGDLTIEVLPKADKADGNKKYWRSRLFDMLRVVHDLPLHSPSTSHLRTRPYDVLHLYLRLLLETCEHLHRRGLHRAYHAERANATALSGRLLFAEQLRHNLVHKERFFVARDRFDFDTPLNRILGQALRVAAQLNGMRSLQTRFQQLCESWPELPSIPATEAFFDRLRFPRGTEAYRPAIAIARLILLRHAPTTQGGRDLPALLFDMNRLWEAFLERTLRRELPEYTVNGQSSTAYFYTEGHSPVTLRPDITIREDYGEEGTIEAILDAKWKVPANARPSAGDLQQMYTYAHFLEARQVALIYPGNLARPQVQGRFGRQQEAATDKKCGVFLVPLPQKKAPCSDWMEEIGRVVREQLFR